MIWNRREFLQTLIAGMATVAAAPLLESVEPFSGAANLAAITPVFHPERPFRIYEVLASAVNTEDDTPIRLTLSRYGQSALSAVLHPRAPYRWVSFPNSGLVGIGIVNESSHNLDVQFGVMQDQHMFWCGPDGTATWLGEPSLSDEDEDIDQDEFEARPL